MLLSTFFTMYQFVQNLSTVPITNEHYFRLDYIWTQCCVFKCNIALLLLIMCCKTCKVYLACIYVQTTIKRNNKLQTSIPIWALHGVTLSGKLPPYSNFLPVHHCSHEYRTYYWLSSSQKTTVNGTSCTSILFQLQSAVILLKFLF